jgi:adenylylsulfate kinase
MVYWITGLSGAGKTTIGMQLCQLMLENDQRPILLDGDSLREVFNAIFGYSAEERRRCAMCYARLCKLLSDQGFTVICCTISMFEDVRMWNRENIREYREIYVKVPLEILIQRNQKNLYGDCGSGPATQVAGLDIEAEVPKKPDFIIENDGSMTVEDAARSIFLHFCDIKVV